MILKQLIYAILGFFERHGLLKRFQDEASQSILQILNYQQFLVNKAAAALIFLPSTQCLETLLKLILDEKPTREYYVVQIFYSWKLTYTIHIIPVLRHD